MNIYNRTLWSELKLPNLTVRVEPRPELPAFVFRVISILELGRGKRTIILGDIDSPMEYVQMKYKNPHAMPERVGCTNFVYVRGCGLAITNVPKAIAAYCRFYQGASDDLAVEKVVPDVLRPGDFLSFKKICESDTKHSIETYRAIDIAEKKAGRRVARAE